MQVVSSLVRVPLKVASKGVCGCVWAVWAGVAAGRPASKKAAACGLGWRRFRGRLSAEEELAQKKNPGRE